MIKVNKLIPEGASGKFGIMKFDISFDSASHLPVDTYTLNMTTFIIANGSIAKNIQTGIYYEYNNGKWNKTTNIPSDTGNSTITTSGIHTITNNDIGVNRINVDIPSAPEPTLIDKTITANGEYNASDDSADGYSEVTVNVTSRGMPKLATPMAVASAVENYNEQYIYTNTSTFQCASSMFGTENAPPQYTSKIINIFTYRPTVITIPHNNSYNDTLDLLFMAGNSFAVEYYQYPASTSPATVSLSQNFENGKVYRVKLQISYATNKLQISQKSITEYNEPIKFTVT